MAKLMALLCDADCLNDSTVTLDQLLLPVEEILCSLDTRVYLAVPKAQRALQIVVCILNEAKMAPPSAGIYRTAHCNAMRLVQLFTSQFLFAFCRQLERSFV